MSLSSEELKTVLDLVKKGSSLNSAINSVGKALDQTMLKWFIPDGKDPVLTSQHQAYLDAKKEQI